MPWPSSSPPALPDPSDDRRDEDWRAGGFGLYVHWPFCAAKCPYCDFNSHVRAGIDQDRWRRALIAEIRSAAEELPGREITSLFFGGGTPSLMPAETVAAVIDAAAACWSIAPDVEITLEANPTSVEAERFRGYRLAGVNRLSMGIQALNDTDLRALGRPNDNLQVHVLASLFFRNQAAYVLGRVIDGNSQRPFAVPILRTPDGRLYLDALLVDPGHLLTLFSLARAYFMVDMEVPSAYIAFLQSLMPEKPRAELYSAVGLQKQGKTIFYRDLHVHLKHSTDHFVLAPGTKGMVMVVFTLPSFPYVFKLIRDRFDPPKDSSPARVKDRYLLVKHHDRVGRMADTLEYSEVALPLARFSPAVLAELQRLTPSSIQIDGDRLVIKHLYIERRLIPLDLYLRDADEQRLRTGVQGFGDALRDLAGANIFPGDLLPKNFGVTRLGRVVFYDYDEICYLTECNFRRIPAARSDEDEYSAEPFYSVGPHDVFPEEFATFLFPPGPARDLFLRLHGDLCDPAFWQDAQRRVRAGLLNEIFPYPQERRFRNAYPDLVP